MFQQLITPVAGSLGLSTIVAILPVATVLVLLGVLRRAAWQAALSGLIVALVIAIAIWQMPVGLALNATANGAVFAVWPVMWIVIAALLLYNIAVVIRPLRRVPCLGARIPARMTGGWCWW